MERSDTLRSRAIWRMERSGLRTIRLRANHGSQLRRAGGPGAAGTESVSGTLGLLVPGPRPIHKIPSAAKRATYLCYRGIRHLHTDDGPANFLGGRERRHGVHLAVRRSVTICLIKA